MSQKRTLEESELPSTKKSKDAGEPYVIELRSDALTKPTEEMRRAMFEAELGYDVYGEDPTVNSLQEKAAAMFGKEAALLVPSGIMGNLICLMVHGNSRGSEALVGDQSHIVICEQGGISQIAGIHSRQVTNRSDGTLDLDELESKIRKDHSDPHYPITRVVCLENTHNVMGGRVIHPEYMEKVHQLALKYKFKIHVDGARILNAAAALNLPPSELLKYADSASISLSKGLANPIGSIILGSKEFITQALWMLKLLGGGMKAGIIAASGIIALEKMSKRLHVDHENARRFTEKLAELQPLGINIDISRVDTNLVMFSLLPEKGTREKFLELLRTPMEGPGGNYEVRMWNSGKDEVRAVFHYQVTADDVDRAIQKIETVLKTL
ncbi:uncharacterized protein [Dysidea avara]|uniref:uncharacterized protein n=1 Tax=Dysidea avara TaxID=196820 RepID=UPI00332E90E5